MFGIEPEEVSERAVSWHLEEIDETVSEIIRQGNDVEGEIDQNDVESMLEDHKKVQWYFA